MIYFIFFLSSYIGFGSAFIGDCSILNTVFKWNCATVRLPLENVATPVQQNTLHTYISVGFKAHNTELNYLFNNTYKINTIQATIFICFTCFKFNLKQFLTQTNLLLLPILSAIWMALTFQMWIIWGKGRILLLRYFCFYIRNNFFFRELSQQILRNSAHMESMCQAFIRLKFKGDKATVSTYNSMT